MNDSLTLPPLSAAIELTQLPAAQLPLVNRFYRVHQRGMKARGDQQVWVARAPEIIASVCLRDMDQCWWLTALLVAPDARGMGVASQLLKQVRSQHRGDIWLFCAPDIAHLYSTNGFKQSSAIPPPLNSRLQRYQRTKSLIAMVNSSR